MSSCPFTNLLDPDLYVDGNHHDAMLEVREKGGSVVKIDDPITGVPYWAVQGRDEVDLICKQPLLFSSEEATAIPMEAAEGSLESAQAQQATAYCSQRFYPHHG